MTNLVIYGAVVPPRKIQSRSSIRQHLRIVLDRIKAKLGGIRGIDYRNIVNDESFNRGDMSIALGANDAIQRATPGMGIVYAKWESIHKEPLISPILFAGGGYFLINDKGELPIRVQKDRDSLIASGVKYAFLGIGINQVSGKSGKVGTAEFADSEKSLVSELLNGATFISVRDQQTLDTLQNLTDSTIFLLGDPALFLALDPRIVTELPLKVKSGARIGINIPFHGPAANGRVGQDLLLYIAFFRKLQLCTNAEFFFMVHFDSEILIAHILKDAGLPVTIVNGDVATLQASYAGLDMHVGGMLHSCILACSVGTPCVALAYDVKHAGFFGLMGIPQLCVPATPFDSGRMMHACLQAFKGRRALRNHIDTQREALRTQANRYLQEQLPPLMHAL